jgi:hypothetical protein
MSKNIYTILIDLNDTKLYPVLRMLFHIFKLKHILLSYKCTIRLGTSYINLVHPLHTIMSYTTLKMKMAVTDENDLIVSRNVQKYIHHTNRFGWYEIILCTHHAIIHLHSIPFPLFFPPLLFIKDIMYTFIIYVTCCLFHIYVYNIIEKHESHSKPGTKLEIWYWKSKR